VTDRSQAPALPRTLARRHVELISLGGVIGAGLFVGSGVAIAAAGPAVVISYVLAGLLLLLIMRMLGEMALARPDIRAFTDFVRAGLGDGTGFVVSWAYWYVWTVTVAVESIAGAVLLQAWTSMPVWVLALAIITVMWCVNVVSARIFAEFEFWFASIKVVAILAFILTAAAFIFGWTGVGPHAVQSFGGLKEGLMPHGFGAVIACMATVFFSFSGAEIATIAAAESRETTHSVARIAAGLIIRIALFYILSVLLIVIVVPWRHVVPGASPFSVTLQQMGFRSAAKAMNLVILTAVLSCLNSALYTSSRTLFALAAHGEAPRYLTGLNRRKCPGRAVTVSAMAGTVGVWLATVSASGAFSFLVNACGAIVLGIYLAVCIAYLRLRRTSADREGVAWKLAPFPVIVYVAIAGVMLVLCEMAASKSMATQLYTSAVPVLVACIAYGLMRGKKRPANVENSAL
jgi:GABA permease